MSYGQKHVLWGHSDPDLWPPNSNQFILVFKWMLHQIPSRPSWNRQAQGHSDPDLWPPNSNQFFLESNCTFVPNLKKIALRCSWDIAFTSMRQMRSQWLWLLIYDHQNLSSLYLMCKWTFVPDLKKIPQDILEIWRSQEWDGRTTWNTMPLTMAITGAEAFKLWRT